MLCKEFSTNRLVVYYGFFLQVDAKQSVAKSTAHSNLAVPQTVPPPDSQVHDYQIV